MRRRSPNPHDRLFKAVFSVPANARALLLGAGLPAGVVEGLGRLRPAPGSAVGHGLTEVHRDLVFSSRLRGRGSLRLLIEHQRREQARMPLRALRYAARELEAWQRRHPRSRRLPAVLPLVLHQGRRPWRGERRLSDLLDLPPDLRRGLGPHLPALDLPLLDLATTTLAALQRLPGPPLARLALAALKLAAEPRADLLDVFERGAADVRAVARDPGGHDALGEVVRYALSVRRGLDLEAVGERLERVLGRRAREVVMGSTAQKLIDEGRAEGLAEGRTEGRAEGNAEGARRVLERLLRTRFGELSPATRRRLQAADPSRLEAWAERVLTAERLEDVFTTAGSARPKRRGRRKAR
ncbi:MAG: Rpn family recombination-promoting nuclease/putative transposase [Planctomycetes bacterium]|nr:Rpn family recombination-promoting nuclease/putative transposase [Planctomycetota bacterium]